MMGLQPKFENCIWPIIELTTTRCCSDGTSARPVSHTFGWTFQNCTRPILELTTTRCCNDGTSARPVSHTFGWTFQKLHPANAWVPRFVSHRFGTTFENSSMKLQGPTIHSKPLTNQIRKKSNFFREEYDKIDTDKQTILCLHIKGQKWSDKP